MSENISKLADYNAPYVLMGVGPSGVGKSTLLSEIGGMLGAKIVSPDDIRRELTGSAADQSKNGEVWREVYARTGEHLREEQNVIIDATNARGEQRRDGVEQCRELGAVVVSAVVVEAPIETALQRNAERERQVPEPAIERMYHQLAVDPPTPADGFDDVFVLDNS